MFEHNNVRNEAILRDVLIFWTWKHPKRSNSARLPHFSKLKISKTKEFCETSFRNGKLGAELTASYQCVLRFFQSTCLKYCALPRKIDARSYEVLHLSRKIILANLHIWYSKMQPFSGNQRRDLLTSLMNMSFVLRLPRKMHLCRSSSNVPCLPSFLEMLQNPHVLLTFEEVHNPLRLPCETTSEPPKVVRTPSAFVHFHFEMCFAPKRRALFPHLNLQKWSDNGVFCTFWLRNVLRATTAYTFSTSQLPKVVRGWGALYILTSKCASRHNGVHFFDISTSKSGPTMVCFVHFDFEMCFAPQRRALFRHLNFQKWCEAEVLCTFWLRNVLRATTACNCSSIIWPAGSAPAALASLLFDPPEPQIIGKNTVFPDFPTFSRICIFFLLTLLASNLSLLSASALLCFSSVHIVGSLTSKLPSIIYLLALWFLWQSLFLWGTDKPLDVDGDFWSHSGPQVIIEATFYQFWWDIFWGTSILGWNGNGSVPPGSTDSGCFPGRLAELELPGHASVPQPDTVRSVAREFFCVL